MITGCCRNLFVDEIDKHLQAIILIYVAIQLKDIILDNYKSHWPIGVHPGKIHGFRSA